ncbi:MAG: hypothetical protein HY360_05390 [Verrucomicrobia bacterium]|nr:hypothetical protein [Verrucomicrobiota bacterium]
MKAVIRCLSFAWAVYFLSLTACALDSSDLLFHLTFEDGVDAEFSRGPAVPVKAPQDVPRRLVKGLIGKGYLFGGKGSSLEFVTGDGPNPACKEMYGARANMFPDSGTVSLWYKPLRANNLTHIFFRAWPIQVVRNAWAAHIFNYEKGGLFFDSEYHHMPWVHMVLTWNKTEAHGYFNGLPGMTIDEIDPITAFREPLVIAGEIRREEKFQSKDIVDDAIIDEVQIFRRPLTDEEARSLFERGQMSTYEGKGTDPRGLIIQPERAFAPARLTAPVLGQPIQPDGDLSEWKGIPAQGCFTDRRLGVLDNDPGIIYVACDAKNLYLAFSCPVDDSVRNDPTHIMYPAGVFLANPPSRDGDIRDNDTITFSLGGKDGRAYQFTINARDALVDMRDGDAAWNANVTWKSRSDFNDWTAELVIPLADVGLAPGDTGDFNVTRSWKLFKSAQNTLLLNEYSQPSTGKLLLKAMASASLTTLGNPWQGALNVQGDIIGPPGEYSVSVHGKGYGQEFTEQAEVAVSEGLKTYEVKHKLEKPGDLAAVVEVKDPQGVVILTRTVPFVYAAMSIVELANYPSWGKLEVTVKPVNTQDARATITLLKDGKALQTQEISKFDDPIKSVAFITKDLPVGDYQVLTQLYRGKARIGEDRQPYAKKPLPEWYRNKVGILDDPPSPWTDVRVKGDSRWERLVAKLPWSKPADVEVQCLGKDIAFHHTLFPSRIVSNGQPLLNGPIRLRLKRNGRETILTAGEFEITKKTRRKVDWKTVASDEGLTVEVRGWIEFDGFTWMEMALSGGPVEHLAVEIPLKKESITCRLLDGITSLGDQPLKASCQDSGKWFGNMKAGFQYFWEDTRGWVVTGEPVMITPGEQEVTINIPFIQKTTDLAKPRTIAFGWAITPSKPIRPNWRFIALYKGVGVNPGDYTFKRPNYPTPMDTPENYQAFGDSLKARARDISAWYAFGPYQWIGSPEYAEWWREWRFTPSDMIKPNPNYTNWGPACHNSSASDLQIWRLNEFVKHYPQQGIYFDCMSYGPCHNEAHGCGYVDENGNRQTTQTLLAARRHYERIYNIVRRHDPQYGWVRIHDWANSMVTAAFADDNWYGEGLVGALGSQPELNYYRVVDLPTARILFSKEQWGHLTSWLTEMAVSAGNDPEKRAEWLGKLITPPQDGQLGEWVLPRWKDYEHVAGIGIVHDMWQIAGNDFQLPWWWVQELERLMHWDDAVRFVGYWDLGDLLQVEGGVPDQVVCAVYYRPAGLPKPDVPELEEIVEKGHKYDPFTVPGETREFLRTIGDSEKGWLVLAPMNNTDQDVTITLRPNLQKLGLELPARARLRDIFRAFDFTFLGANIGEPRGPYFKIQGVNESFPLVNGTARVTIPKRNFRMLLLEDTK